MFKCTGNEYNKYMKIYLLYVLVYFIIYAPAAWFSNWNYRMIISNNYACGQDLTNFPLLIHISNNENVKNYCSSNGNDIFFTLIDGITRLNHEMEYFNLSDGELYTWVGVPLLSSTQKESNIIYMYFDKTKISSQENASNVWKADYSAVWHFNESAGPQAHDSTSNTNTGTADSGVTFNVPGKIGKCYDFDGINPDISVTDSADFDSLDIENNVNFTLSAWIKTTSTNATIMANRGGASYPGYDLRISEDKLKMYLKDDNDAAHLTYTSPSSSFSDGSWRYITAVFDRSNKFNCFINGVSFGTTDISTRNSHLTNRYNFIIGRLTATANPAFSNFMDEVRVVKALRSAGWIMTEFSNQMNPASFRILGNSSEYGVPAVTINALSSPPAVAGQQASFLITADTAGTGILTNFKINFGDNTREDFPAAGSPAAQTVTHIYKSGDVFLLSAAAYSIAGKIRTNLIYITPAPYSMPGASNIQMHYQNEGLRLTFSLPSSNIRRAVIYRNSLQLANILPVSSDMEYLDRYLFYDTVYTYQIGVEYNSGMVLSSTFTNSPFRLELAQKIIGSKGGSIGNLFTELVIPQGALPGDTLIRLVVSSNLRYNFDPGYCEAYNQVAIETEPPVSFSSNAGLSLMAPFFDNKIHMMPDDGNYERIFLGNENLLTISAYSGGRAWIPVYCRIADKNILPNLNYKILTMDISAAGIFGVGIILNNTEYENKVTVKNRVFAPLSSYSAMAKVTIFFPNPSFEEVTLRIYSMNGKIIYKSHKGGKASMVSWDGMSDNGKISDSGLYIAVIQKGGRVKDIIKREVYLLK
ncbi:MAG: hypothetical protein A2096_05030 [Spirochaetes bacterium GWF1_41_5]|nr:MAG: hypothetical protein A2096_05030 [Spirochaetes bacterium GWF1_41_5]